MKHHLDNMTDNPADNLWECLDCWEAFDYWPSSECSGEPTPVSRAVRDATTGLPESVKKRMALVLGLREDR